MGLDVYFKKYHDYSLLKKVKEITQQYNVLCEEFKDNSKIQQLKTSISQLEVLFEQNIEQDEIAYFRKAYFILSYFGYTVNCSDMILTKQDVQNLIGSLRAVLALNKQEYSISEYENKVYAILRCDNDNFWYNYTPNDVPLDMYETAIDHLEYALEDVKDGEPVILHAWW